MAENVGKTGTDIEEEEESASGSEEKEREAKGGLDIHLIKYIFEPDDDRLPELTDIPLNQVNSLTWMATYEHATEDLVKRIKYLRDKADDKVKGIYKPKLLSEIWRKFYYKHRRSLEGAGVFRAAQLANKQLETQELEEERPDGIDWRK